MRYEAGLALAAHNHLGTLVVALTRIQLRVTESAAKMLRLDPGAVRWINAGHYAISNPANQPGELIEIELKQAQSPAREVLPHLLSTSKEPMPASL